LGAALVLPHFAYALFMLLALAVFLLARRLQPQPADLAALSWKQRLLLGWAILVGGALGAKIGWTLSTGSSWLSAPTWLADGKTITTGLMGAYLAVELVKLVVGIHIKTGDNYALPLALALAVGRWGCFFNGCCFGIPTDLPWGVVFHDGIPRHPTQIYESLFHLGMAVILIAVIRCAALRLQRLKLYLIAYGLFRFGMEYLRPEPRDWYGLTFYQVVCLLFILGLSVQWWFDRRWNQRDTEQETVLKEVAIP
jgi:prolipoprotein diacylglyceryltransferase